MNHSDDRLWLTIHHPMREVDEKRNENRTFTVVSLSIDLCGMSRFFLREVIFKTLDF